MARFSPAIAVVMSGVLSCFASAALGYTGIDWSRSWVYASGTRTATDPAYANVTLVGHANGVADTTHQIVVHLRDYDDTPEAGVTVSFVNRGHNDGPALGRRVCESQIGETFAGCDVYGAATVSVVTDANGEAVLRVEGASDGSERGKFDNASEGSGLHNAGVITISDDTNINWSQALLVTAFDLDGGGMGASDLSILQQDIFDFGDPINGTRYRCDYNFNGTVNSADMSIWLTAFFNAGSYSGCGTTYCP